MLTLNNLHNPREWMNAPPVEVLVMRACDPSLPEPNYALHLEVAEYINKKKANTPRETAMLIARLANHRNPHIGILALSLLSTLVQTCGYPFHLQISTKEFLNELVRRFPERPPPFPGPVMQRILDIIQEWRETLCMESRWKEDLGNIRDMHRLLTFKGYRFRDLGARNARDTATTVTASLKTAEELEAEDREAQSAKLQELIRRGTPRDLALAQELMKSLAGALPDDRKPDYKSQALNELNKLEQKVVLMNEMLDQVREGERFVGGDVYDQVAQVLIGARPRIQKWVSDAETEDPESLDTYLQINDQINTVLTRYEAYKKGDYTMARNPVPPELESSSVGAPGSSLIDFDDPVGGSAAEGGKGKGIEELADLFGGGGGSAPLGGMGGFGNGNGLGGAQGMNFSQPFQPFSQQTSSSFSQPTSTPFSQPTSTPFSQQTTIPFSSPGQAGQAAPNRSSSPAIGGFAPSSQHGSIMLPGTPRSGGQVQQQNSGNRGSPNYFGGLGQQTQSGMGGAGMSMGSGTTTMGAGATTGGGQQQQQAKKDPFADLAGLF